MSLPFSMSMPGRGSFPRSRGDEPVTQAVARDVLGFSPLTRG